MAAVYIPAMLRFGMVMSTRVAVMARMEALEMVRMLLVSAMLRIRSTIAVPRIERAVYVAIEARSTMVITSGADERAVAEPLRPIVAIRSAIIRRIVEVSIRAYGCDTHSDHNL